MLFWLVCGQKNLICFTGKGILAALTSLPQKRVTLQLLKIEKMSLYCHISEFLQKPSVSTTFHGSLAVSFLAGLHAHMTYHT